MILSANPPNKVYVRQPFGVETATLRSLSLNVSKCFLILSSIVLSRLSMLAVSCLRLLCNTRSSTAGDSRSSGNGAGGRRCSRKMRGSLLFRHFLSVQGTRKWA